MRYDSDRILFIRYYKQGNYYVALTAVELYPASGNKKLRGGLKRGYVVSVINSSPKPGEQDAFCKRIKNKKDAEKYYQLAGTYCRSFGDGGLINIWENIDKHFQWKITHSKDYYIPLPVIVSETKQHIAAVIKLSTLPIRKELNLDQKCNDSCIN